MTWFPVSGRRRGQGNPRWFQEAAEGLEATVEVMLVGCRTSDIGRNLSFPIHKVRTHRLVVRMPSCKGCGSSLQIVKCDINVNCQG